MIEDLHFLLMRCFNYSNHAIVQRTATISLLPGQSKILECLLEHEGNSPKEIGAMCAIDKSTMTSLIGKMEKQGLVLRKAHPDDKRSVTIWLTEKGRVKANEAASLCSEVDSIAVKNLTDKQKKQLMEYLHTIIRNLEENS